MTSFNYARAKATADRLITRFGKTTASQLIKPGVPSGSSFDPEPGDPTLYPVKCVVLNYNNNQFNDRILVGDRRVLIAVNALDIQPDPSWTLSVKMKGDAAAKTYQIINIMPLEPGDVTLLWDAQCRAA